MSRRFDLTFFIAPAALSLLLVIPCLLGFVPGGETPTWAWLLCVVGIDVAHVWATLYRVYLDPIERNRRPLLYGATPVLVGLGCGVVASLSLPWFWRLMAYLAAYHFIKQQVGFVALYRHRAGQKDPWVRTLDNVGVWVGTGVPLLYWHSHLPRQFWWFMEGDFMVGLPAEVMNLAWPLYGLVALLWAGAQIHLWRRSWPSQGKILTMVATWLVWGIGTVWLNFDYTFTVTNVLLHGIPYMALVWVSSRRETPSPTSPVFQFLVDKRHTLAFVGLLVMLALMEEWSWDVLVWREHPQLFGDWSGLFPEHDILLVMATSLLSIPQITHYILDGYIWRLDGSNPGLYQRLFGPS